MGLLRVRDPIAPEAARRRVPRCRAEQRRCVFFFHLFLAHCADADERRTENQSTTSGIKAVVILATLAMTILAMRHVNKKVDQVKGKVIYARQKARYAPTAPPPLLVLTGTSSPQASKNAPRGGAAADGRGTRASPDRPAGSVAETPGTGFLVDGRWRWRRRYPHARAAAACQGGKSRRRTAVRRPEEERKRCGRRGWERGRRCEQHRGGGAGRQA